MRLIGLLVLIRLVYTVYVHPARFLSLNGTVPNGTDHLLLPCLNGTDHCDAGMNEAELRKGIESAVYMVYAFLFSCFVLFAWFLLLHFSHQRRASLDSNYSWKTLESLTDYGHI